MFQIKKILRIMLLMLVCIIVPGAFASDNTDVNNSGNLTLYSAISIDKVPKAFYGSWRVVAKLSETRSYDTFKADSVDIWNLSREHDVINLSNPFTGASASITVSYLENNVIKFSKIGNYDNKRLTDVVEMKISGDKFSGINRITLETLSNVDGHVIKKQSAVYLLQGEKISGTNLIGK